MVTELNSDDVFAFKKYVFNRVEPQDERIKEITAKPLEVSVEKYLQHHLKPKDAENILRFKENVLHYCSSQNVPIALIAVGSTTYPLALMEKAHYHDIDIVISAKEEKDIRFLEGRYDSQLVKTIEQYICSAARKQGYVLKYGETLNILEITNRNAVFIPYGRPNTELVRPGFSPLHLVVEIYKRKDFDAAKMSPEDMAEVTAPTSTRVIARQRRKNLPFVVLHQ